MDLGEHIFCQLKHLHQMRIPDVKNCRRFPAEKNTSRNYMLFTNTSILMSLYITMALLQNLADINSRTLYLFLPGEASGKSPETSIRRTTDALQFIKTAQQVKITRIMGFW
jgi:hypothetical protein